MTATTSEHQVLPLSDDLLVGAPAIAAFVGLPVRKVRYLISHHNLPALGIAYALEGLSRPAVIEDRPEDAAMLFGAAAGLRRNVQGPDPLPRPDRFDEAFQAEVRAALGDAYEACLQKGETMPLDLVQSVIQTTVTQPGALSKQTGLSPGRVIHSLRRCAIPSAASTARPR